MLQPFTYLEGVSGIQFLLMLSDNYVPSLKKNSSHNWVTSMDEKFTNCYSQLRANGVIARTDTRTTD